MPLRQTGLETMAIRELARAILEHSPVVAIANDNHPEIAALNVMPGEVGARGGIVRRSRNQPSQASAAAGVTSARAVLLDSQCAVGLRSTNRRGIVPLLRLERRAEQSRLALRQAWLP